MLSLGVCRAQNCPYLVPKRRTYGSRGFAYRHVCKMLGAEPNHIKECPREARN
jgi:hypothetical protein